MGFEGAGWGRGRPTARHRNFKSEETRRSDAEDERQQREDRRGVVLSAGPKVELKF